MSYQHLFSANAVGDLHGMVRDNSNDFYSNSESTPVEVFQHNSFRDGYFKAGFTFNRGRQEWKVGVESDNAFTTLQIPPSMKTARFLPSHFRAIVPISNKQSLCKI